MFIHLVLADKKTHFSSHGNNSEALLLGKIFTNALGCLCVICGTCKLILIGSKHLDNRHNSEALLLGKCLLTHLNVFV